jgi:RNA polymerase sigma-70 factor (ECF subfamily)
MVISTFTINNDEELIRIYDLTDQENIKRVLSGETDLYRDIIKKYESQIASVIFGMIGKTPEAEDIGQETFIRFFKNLNNFRGDSAVGTYLTRIAINLSLNEIKRRKRKNMMFFSGDDHQFDLAGQDDFSGVKEDKDLINKAIQKLAPKFRSVIVLRLIEGYSTQETAKMLKIPVGTVLSRLTRAQKKLKEFLLQ